MLAIGDQVYKGFVVLPIISHALVASNGQW